jgi:hypothetical protein
MTNGKTRFFLAGMTLTLIGSVMGVLGVMTAQAAGAPGVTMPQVIPDEPKEPPSTTTSTSTTIVVVEVPTTQYVAPTTTEPPTTLPEPPQVAPNAFLECVKQRESGGDYGAYNPSGAAGAYQMLLSTSNTVARWMGRPDLIGVGANNWSPADQDAGALVLYEHMGTSPWYYPPKPC